MPGFVDVTGWTNEEVRRLGHADDETPSQIWKPRAKSQGVKYTFEVWER